MMADNPGHLGIGVNVGENPLADYGVLLHLAALTKSKRAGFLKQACWKADLPDVMDKADNVALLLAFCAKTEAFGNVTRVDGNSRRMAGRVAIARVECCYQSRGK